MKKKKIAIALLMSMAVIFICGCSKSSPKAAADTFMQGIKTQDLNKMASVYDVDSIDMKNTVNGYIKDVLEGNISPDSGTLDQYLPYLNKLFEFDYILSDEEINGDNATVKVKITTYSYGDAVKKAYSSLLNQSLSLVFSFDLSKINSTIESKVIEELEKAEKDSTLTATLKLSKKNNGWIVDDISQNTDFINALTGGLYNAVLLLPNN